MKNIIYYNTQLKDNADIQNITEDSYEIKQLTYVSNDDELDYWLNIIQSSYGSFGSVTIENSLTIDEEKQNKITELSNICNQTIINGFYSDADETKKLYDFELENQINMMGLQVKAENGETISYYAKGEDCHDYTPAQFLQLIDDSVTFKFNTIEKYKNVLKPKVMACTTIEEINAITFD